MATYDEILTYIEAAVPELTNVSDIALYKKIAEVIANKGDISTLEMENTKAIINDIIGRQRYGKSDYYETKAKAYQEGDTLIQNPDTLAFYYPVIDTSLRLVKQAAFKEIVSETNSILTLKVAKLNSGTGLLEKLTSGEQSAFDSYMLNFEIPGLPLLKTSLDPNEIGFNSQVTYYKAYDLTQLKTDIQTQLNTFRDEFIFNSEFFSNDLETYLKNAIPGIRNVYLTLTTMDSVAFTSSVTLTAGYFNYVSGIINNFTYVGI